MCVTGTLTHWTKPSSESCYIISVFRQPPIRSRYARLSILVAPDPPKIMQGPFIEVVEDSEQVFECVSVGGKPPAEFSNSPLGGIGCIGVTAHAKSPSSPRNLITWVDGEGGVLSENVVYTVQPMLDGRRFTARSILRLRPRRHHDKQNLTCQAQNTADRAYRSATIKLEEHLKHLSKLLDAIAEEGFRLKLTKCKFAAQSVRFLGHIVEGNTITPLKDNLRSIAEFPAPQNKKQIRQFLDHKPLENLNIKNRTDDELGDMTHYLSQYNFVIKYNPGKCNTEADCLSRNPVYESHENEEDKLKTVNIAKQKRQSNKSDRETISSPTLDPGNFNNLLFFLLSFRKEKERERKEGEGGKAR
ncbi:Irregular chiasm C-roughest protein [Eumeta japonica]|uniref:Irregular chiasm C-roughest protein n=1 Tax=Eumeta variegata TaxID=151549 RepID=A0A4C1SZN1_EUMVA|nr:Irregular chiasm C-roughest protein [Eumeta japonica]